MTKIRALYVDDDKDNLTTYGPWLTEIDVELITISDLPDNVFDFLPLVEQNEINFLIVDDHFEKTGVNYNGADIIKFIRALHKEIYILFFVIDNHQPSHLINRILSRGDFSDQIKEVVDEVRVHVQAIKCKK